MIRFSLLGPLELRAADGTELRSVLAQPKRLVLLAYLAITPGAFQRRDTLLALFWPELDQTRARAALRQAVYHLRKGLGADVLIRRGDDELGVDSARLWCDVAAFRQAVREKRCTDAIELYHGDLLNGVFVDDAPELERWVEEERARLRDAAASATWSVAEDEAAAGDFSAAAVRARRAVELTPHDEESVRRLITFFARTGDRAGALRAYQDLARRLEREYEATPSAATKALIEAVRTAGLAPADRPRPAPIAPPGAPASIAVLPFPYRGQPEFGYLAEGMTDLLSLAIDGTELLRSVDPRALLSWHVRDGTGLSDADLCRAVGEHFGAEHCVLGGIVQSGRQFRVHAALYDAAEPGAPRAQVVAEAGVDEVFALVDRLAAELLVHGAGAPVGALTRTAARTTESLPALKAYLNGEHAFRVGRFTPAAEAFQRAVVEDPSFALAHYRLATLAEWAGILPLAEAAAARALLHAERLAVNDRRLLEALQAYFEGDARRAERLYREVLAVYPDSVEAWFQLAKLGYFLNSLQGRRLADALEPLQRAAALDPDNIILLVHLADVAAKEGRAAEVETLTGRALELLRQGDYTDFPLIVRVLRAFAVGDGDEQARLWEELPNANEFTLFWSFQILAMLVGSLGAAARVAGLMTEVSRPKPVRLFGRLVRAELELAHGRWSGAQVELDAAAQLDASVSAVYRALLALVGFREPDPAELRALRDELLNAPAEEPEPEAALAPWFTAHSEVLGATRSYLIGLLHARLGETEDAEARAAELEATGGAFHRAAQARDSARGIRALLAAQRGDPAEALVWLERCELAAPMHCYNATALYGRLHERYLRAELLGRLGRDAEAETWYAVLGEDSPYGFVFLAPSHLRRAELIARRGEHEQARVHFLRFLELWRDCDPELRPLVATVAGQLDVATPTAGEVARGGAVAAAPMIPVRAAPPRRRRALASVLLAITLLVVGTVVAISRFGKPELPPPSRLAVGRIEAADGGEDARLVLALQSMLATNLARLSGVEVVSEMRMHELLAQLDGEPEGAGGNALLLRAARAAGASQMLEGMLHRESGGGYRLELRRVELETGAVRAAHVVRGASPFALADAAAASLAAEFGVAPPALRFADVTTASLVAYRFYEEGLREYYAGDHGSALRLFRAALAEDSTFAMAAYYAANSADLPHSTRLMQHAVRFARQASDRERLLIEAGWAASADEPRRLALAETLAVRYPAEPAGHLFLGQARIWSGDFLGALPHLQRVVAMDSVGLRGGAAGCRACDALWEITTAYTLADSLDAAERVARDWVRLRPGSATPWIALGFTLEGKGRYAEAMAATDSATARQPGNPATGVRTGILIRSGDFDEFEGMLHELFRFGGQPLKEEVLWSLALGLRTQGRMREALEITHQHYRLAARPNAVPADLLSSRTAEAQVLFDAGRPREAAAVFEAIGKVEFADESMARGARHRAWMLTHAAAGYAAAGDTARLRILADSVQRLGARSAYARDQRLHHHIRGLLLRVRGRPAEAATEFRRALFSPVSGYTRTNFELARALLDAGRPAEAVPVLQAALRGPVGASGYYLSRTEIHELLARALDEAGRAEEAIPHYQWVAAAWGRGDPEFRERATAASRRRGASLRTR